MSNVGVFDYFDFTIKSLLNTGDDKMFKRVIIKLSGEAIGENSVGFCDKIINSIVDDIIEVLNMGVEVSVVIGGGNFWRGRNADSNMDRSTADSVGMMATIMNGLYVSDVFIQKGINCKVMTPFKCGTFTYEFNKNEALDVMSNGGVCIFSGGIGHPFFSTDTITALRASELGCDGILYAKNVDGIYDKDPNKHIDAKKYEQITYEQIIKNDLKAIDISAISLCNEQKIDSIVFALDEEKSILKSIKNDDSMFEIGTKVTYKLS